MHPVSIENESLRMEVWPSFGGKIASLVDKADEFELLFNYPVEIPTNPQYDTSYANGWHAGWDECFPAVLPGPYTGHPYDGTAVPDHGELWGLPTTAVPSKLGITTVWHGLRFGYRLTRKLSLDGPSVRADYTLINLAPFDFRFIWTGHPLLSMEGQAADAEINLSGPSAFRQTHDADYVDVQQPFNWPSAPGGEDLSKPASLPPRRAWKAHAIDPISWPAKVLYPSRGRSLKLQFESPDVTAYWAIWLNSGGWAGHHHFSVQATTGRFDQIDRCVRDGSAARIGASGRCDWSFQMTVG
jgi:hypothetical protein